MTNDPSDVEEYIQCPECASTHIVRDDVRGELLCSDCGMVLNSVQIDMGPDWRSFDQAQHMARSRTGSPLTLLKHDRGLSTEIGPRNVDSFGRAIPPRNKAQIYRMRKWQRQFRIRTALDRNLSSALTELERTATGLGLPFSIRESCALIYRRAAGTACRQCGGPRTFEEISSFSKVHRKEIARLYRSLIRELGLKIYPPSPSDYVLRFASELHLSGETIVLTNDLIRRAESMEITSGRDPISIAAASLYISSIMTYNKRTQEELSSVTGVTQVTIRNRYKELLKLMDILVICCAILVLPGYNPGLVQTITSGSG